MHESARLNLPFIMPSQAQKHLTHNEALQALDVAVQASVVSRSIGAPPAEADEGRCFIVAAPATGAWAGREHRLAARQAGAWRFLAPRAGWIVFVEDEASQVLFQGGAWRVLAPRGGRDLARFGVGCDADDHNRLAVAAPAALFSHAGADHRLNVNKAASGRTASLVFQSDHSGRAEIGLVGSDALSIKLSADGAAWTEAMRLDPSSGHVGVGVASPSARLHVDGAVRLKSYAAAELPSAAASGAGAVVFVADEAGGPVLAFSDGAVWRRVTDRVPVA